MKRHKIQALVPISLALSLALSACGGGPSDPLQAGLANLQSGDHTAAETSFAAAMETSEKGGDDWRTAAVGRYQAMAHTSPKQATTDFIALAGEEGTNLDQKDYSKVLGALYDSKAYMDALSIADSGLKRWPESAKMKTYIEKLVQKAGGDADLSSALEGMGYLGGDD